MEIIHQLVKQVIDLIVQFQILHDIWLINYKMFPHIWYIGKQNAVMYQIYHNISQHIWYIDK